MYKTNKTDDLTVIYGVCCVRTERLGSPNSALLPYKMGGTLQRLFAVRGMGRDPQRREPEAIEYSLLAKAPCGGRFGRLEKFSGGSFSKKRPELRGLSLI